VKEKGIWSQQPMIEVMSLMFSLDFSKLHKARLTGSPFQMQFQELLRVLIAIQNVS